MPEYQHFVPQFILRKYSDYKEPKRGDLVNAGPKALDKAKSKAKAKAKVNIINLENGFDKMKIEERRTSRICGLNDMYGPEIEHKFGLLEMAASKVIREIEDDFANNSMRTRLSRPNKDTLRRFLFIMLYRSRKFYNRFDKSVQEYDADDRTELINYMNKKGFATPKDVWLDNFRTFLSVRLGYDSERWEAELMATTYPVDAKWFVHHMNNFFLCFCTPADPRDEFLLTQNAYGDFEGPNSSDAWADWHNFAPISPRLLIVLRCIWIQPVNGNPLFNQISSFFERMVSLACAAHLNPATARSWLVDMPVERPQTSYQKLQCLRNARDQAQVKHLLLADDDTFDFKLFLLPSKHVQTINTIFLENAFSTWAIAFGSHSALLRALESYLRSEKQGIKVVYTNGQTNLDGLAQRCIASYNQSIVQYLPGLEKIVQSLGSRVTAKCTVRESSVVLAMPALPTKFEERYEKLGWDGRSETWIEDMDQAICITMLHYYTEKMIKFRGRRIKDHMRQNRCNILHSLHPRLICCIYACEKQREAT